MNTTVLKYIRLIPVMMGVLVLVGCGGDSQFPVPDNFIEVNTVVYQTPNDDKLFLFNLENKTTNEVNNKGIYPYNSHIKWIKQTEEFKKYNFLEMNDWNENPRFVSLRSLLDGDDLRYYQFNFPENTSSNTLYVSDDLSIVVTSTQENDITNLDISTVNGSDHKKITIDSLNSVYKISDNHKYLYLKSKGQGSTPAGDLLGVNIEAATFKTISVPEYFTYPFISHTGEAFIVSQYPEILGDGSYVDNGYKMILFTINSDEQKILDTNSTSEYINVDWHSSDRKFIYQKRPTMHTGTDKAEIDARDCSSSISEYNLDLNKINELIGDDPNECLLLFGYNPNNEDEIYFQAKDISRNIYAFKKYTISTNTLQTVFENEQGFDVYALTFIE